jgi:hypothetical protein
MKASDFLYNDAVGGENGITYGQFTDCAALSAGYKTRATVIPDVALADGNSLNRRRLP